MGSFLTTVNKKQKYVTAFNQYASKNKLGSYTIKV